MPCIVSCTWTHPKTHPWTHGVTRYFFLTVFVCCLLSQGILSPVSTGPYVRQPSTSLNVIAEDQQYQVTMVIVKRTSAWARMATSHIGSPCPQETSVCDCMRGFRIVRPSGRVRWEAIHSSCLAIGVQPPARAACPASGRMFSGRHVRSMSGATVCVLGVRLIRWGSIAV